MNTEELAQLLARTGQKPTRLIFRISWAIGAVFFVSGLVLDLYGLWTSRPYLVNIVSGLTAFFFGLPLVLFFLNQTRDRLDTLDAAIAREVELNEQRSAHLVGVDSGQVVVYDTSLTTRLRERRFFEQLCEVTRSQSYGVLGGIAVCESGRGDGLYPIRKYESSPGEICRIELRFDVDDATALVPVAFGKIDVTSGSVNIIDPCHISLRHIRPKTVPVPNGTWIVCVAHVEDTDVGGRRVGALIIEPESAHDLG